MLLILILGYGIANTIAIKDFTTVLVTANGSAFAHALRIGQHKAIGNIAVNDRTCAITNQNGGIRIIFLFDVLIKTLD